MVFISSFSKILSYHYHNLEHDAARKCWRVQASPVGIANQSVHAPTLKRFAPNKDIELISHAAVLERCVATLRMAAWETRIESPRRRMNKSTFEGS